MTAVSGTVLVAAGAFWLSFTALRDLARRAGIDSGQAWAWPLIVDGIIVVATVSVVALTPHGRTATWYPWMLLVAGARVSVAANAAHAVVGVDPGTSPELAAAVSAVPPLVFVAITHLTVELTRRTRRLDPSAGSTGGRQKPRIKAIALDTTPQRQALAHERRSQGWTNVQIARALGVHPSTVGRWLNGSAAVTPSDRPAAERTG
ncbi:DUF2637 domain-containing protein [Jiangella muralis]|uniref:DUF2637 domain-containing protein n=1 Tax=Jiangella muralis TaxID=702383 RepID=UPI00069FD678|nr:DUF2637 domain-containing protein [Jiangella muralis]